MNEQKMDKNQLGYGIEVIPKNGNAYSDDIALKRVDLERFIEDIDKRMKYKNISSVAASTIFETTKDNKTSFALTMKINEDGANFEIEINNDGKKIITTKLWDQLVFKVFSNKNLEKIRERAFNYINNIGKDNNIYKNHADLMKNGIEKGIGEELDITC